MIFIAVAAIVMAACGGNKIQGDEAQVDPVMLDTLTKVEVPKEKVVIAPKKKSLWNKEAVDAQIRACFAEVNKMSDGVIDIEKLDEMFCSKDFLELKSMLEKKISKGEVMFEGDEGYHWLANIGTPVAVDSVKTELLTTDQARAEVWLKDGQDNHGYLAADHLRRYHRYLHRRHPGRPSASDGRARQGADLRPSHHRHPADRRQYHRSEDPGRFHGIADIMDHVCHYHGRCHVRHRRHVPGCTGLLRHIYAVQYMGGEPPERKKYSYRSVNERPE